MVVFAVRDGDNRCMRRGEKNRLRQKLVNVVRSMSVVWPGVVGLSQGAKFVLRPQAPDLRSCGFGAPELFFIVRNVFRCISFGLPHFWVGLTIQLRRLLSLPSLAYIPANFQPTTHRMAKVMANIRHRPATTAAGPLEGLYKRPKIIIIEI